MDLERVKLRITIYDVWQDHSDKAKGYIERMQATIPGFTAKKIAAIRNGLSGL